MSTLRENIENLAAHYLNKAVVNEEAAKAAASEGQSEDACGHIVQAGIYRGVAVDIRLMLLELDRNEYNAKKKVPSKHMFYKFMPDCGNQNIALRFVEQIGNAWVMKSTKFGPEIHVNPADIYEWREIADFD